MLKTIIFDIDGVITDLSFFHFLAWKSVLSFYNVNLQKEEWANYNGRQRLTILKMILKNHNITFDEKTLTKISNQKNDLFVHLIKHNLTPKNIINGVRQLIDDAITRGLKLVAVSSSANAVLEMKCLGLFDKFTYVSDYQSKRLSSLSQTEKKVVSPLLFSLKTLGIESSECIGLEDHVDGVLEYKSAGIFSVAIANYQEDIKKEADFWAELPEQIVLEEIIFSYYKRDTQYD
ncbi:MAG: HAD hydrolase-like protein [Mycoplasmataceae bacterium]|nr:HAD hydrolase-like protein [Mycoplasmataceae bacterium]